MSIRQQARDLEALLPRIMMRLFASGAEDRSMELPLAQLRVARVLMSGAHTMSALADELNTTVSAMTQIGDRMEKAGLVERVADPHDRRCRLLRLTQEGLDLMRSRQLNRVEAVEQILLRLSPEVRDNILSDLRELLAATERNSDVAGSLEWTRVAVIP